MSWYTRECAQCGKTFPLLRATSKQRFCGSPCQHAASRRDHVGYSGAHARVRDTKGRAFDQQCAHCGDKAGHWAYDKGDPDERTEMCKVRGIATELTYSVNPEHYFPLCQRCHRKHDQRVNPNRGEGGRWVTSAGRV